MTVWSNESISAIVTRRQRWAIWRGSDCNKKRRFPYFCVFSSFGKNPSCRSEASSRWLATSFCYQESVSLSTMIHPASSVPLPMPFDFESKAQFWNPSISHPSPRRNSFSIGMRFLTSSLGGFSGLQEKIRSLNRLRIRIEPTFCKIILNLQIFLIRWHGKVQSGHGIPLRLSDWSTSIMGGYRVLTGHRLEGGRRGCRSPGGSLQHDAHIGHRR